MTMTMTDHLLTGAPFRSALALATQPAFLRLAGQGHIATPLLAAYLSQDRLYQHGYIRFVAGMLTKVRFDLPDRELGRQTTNALIDALIGIRNELEFFERIAEKHGFGLETPMPPSTTAGPTPITRAYVDFFTAVAGPGTELLEGLVALWATEKCYLEAWRWASTFAPVRDSASEDSSTGAGDSKWYAQDADGGALRGELMPNWTNQAFADVVAGMGRLVDEVAEAEKARRGAEVVERRCEEVWRQVLWLEERFWPVVEG